MPYTLSLGARRLRASLRMTAFALAGCALFTALGSWQWQRGDAKQAVHAQFDAASAAAVPLGSRTTAQLPRFAHVEVTGRYDGARQLLLDNMSHAGRPGYEVLTPLRLADGRVLLVNRGWVPFGGYRDRLPDVSVSQDGEKRISGRLDELPAAGLAAGRAPPAPSGSWPRLTSFPSRAEIAAALGTQIEPRILLLDREVAADGYLREWRAPGMSPLRHYAYAVQWWALALAVAVVFLVVNLEKQR